MLGTEDHTDVGSLINFALQPTLRPGRSPEYRRLLSRYRQEVDFRGATDAVLHGLAVRVLSDGDFGLVLGVEPESPFAFRFSDLPYTQSREGRLMAGLVLVGLAAWAFPAPAEVDEPRPRRVHEVEFEAWLRATCERLRSRDEAGEPVPEEGLDESWRTYVAMPATMVGQAGRGSGRLSPKCSMYWVRGVLSWLGEQGMAHADAGPSSRGSWQLTERFRIHVRDMASEPVYRLLAAVGRGEDPTAGMVTVTAAPTDSAGQDPDDPGGAMGGEPE